MKRTDSHIFPEKGTHTCNTPGLCKNVLTQCMRICTNTHTHTHTHTHTQWYCMISNFSHKWYYMIADFPTLDTLKFDNSYSWIHSKEIFYCVRMLPPADTDVCRSTPHAGNTPIQDETEPTQNEAA